MNLFIRKIILGIIPLILCFVLSYFWSTSYISKGDYFSIPEEVHSVILGHSHSACAFDDKIIPGFYNLSQNTEGYPYSYFKASRILEENKHIKNIFIEYTNNQIEPWASNRVYGIYLDINVPRTFPVADKEFILEAFYRSGNIPKVTNAIVKSYKNNFEFIFSGSDNYLESEWHNHRIPTRIFRGDTTSKAVDLDENFIDIYKIQEENLSYLFNLKALCKKHDVNLFFLRSPMPKHVSFNNEPVFNNIKETFFADIPFLDFKDYPMELEFFADNQHLNKSGSVEFSNYFKDSLVQNGSINKVTISRIVEEQIENAQKRKGLPD